MVDNLYFDARKYEPQPGQILISYKSKDELIDSYLKREVISLLMQGGEAQTAVDLLCLRAEATEIGAINVCQEMVYDLYETINEDKVAQHPYIYETQILFYTWPEYVKDGWEIIENNPVIAK